MKKLAIAAAVAAALTFGIPSAALATQGGHVPVMICHKPGTPAEQTLTVDQSAVPGHLRHGDTLGACSTPTSEPTTTPTEEPTETPTPEPTETSTPEPTSTPTEEPTSTPEPTKEPCPEPTTTPEPTETPTPEPTVTPEPSETPTPEPSTPATEQPTPPATTSPSAAPSTTPEVQAQQVAAAPVSEGTPRLADTGSDTVTPENLVLWTSLMLGLLALGALMMLLGGRRVNREHEREQRERNRK